MSENKSFQTKPESYQLINLGPDLPMLQVAWAEYLLSEHAKTTRAAYIKGVKVFVDWMNDQGLSLADITPVIIRDWRDGLKTSYALQTVNLWLTALRRFYAFLIEELNIPILNPASSVLSIRRNKDSRRHKRDELTDSEVLAVFDTCVDSELGRRDRAILALMAYCALRTVEVQRADISDLATRKGRTILWVRGKGHAEANDFVVLPIPAESAVRSWLAVRGGKRGPLFWSLSNQNEKDRLSRRAIRGMVKSRFNEAGVANGGKTTHSLRHSAIINVIRNGATPLQAQAMARHRSFDTMLGYFHEVGRIDNPAEDLINYSKGK
jgi:integrase/recombinase XerD